MQCTEKAIEAAAAEKYPMPFDSVYSEDENVANAQAGAEQAAFIAGAKFALAALPSPQAAGVGASDLIDRAALLKKMKAERDRYLNENFVIDPETGASESSPANEEYRSYLEENIEAIELFPAAAVPRLDAGNLAAGLMIAHNVPEQAQGDSDVIAEAMKEAQSILDALPPLYWRR